MKNYLFPLASERCIRKVNRQGALLKLSTVLNYRVNSMNSTLMEELLNEEEGTTLDFKREQYRFERASDEQKGELLKDILAFANGWRAEVMRTY